MKYDHEILRHVLIIGLVAFIFIVSALAFLIILIYFGQKQEHFFLEENNKPGHEFLIQIERTLGRSGRMGLGNQIALFSYMYLTALNEGTDFVFDKKFVKDKNIGFEIFQVFPTLEQYHKSTGKMIIPEMDLYKNIKPLFGFSRVHDVKLYQNYRSLLRVALGIKTPIHWNGYDVTVHLRFDDIETIDTYTVLPLKFYEEVFDSITEKKERVLIVCKTPETRFLKQVLEKTLDTITTRSGVKTVDVYNHSLKEDFDMLLSSKIFVMSCGTFSYFGALLSPTVKEIHVPYYGINAQVTEKEKLAICSADWKSTNETKIVIHTNHMPIKNIMKIENL